MNYQVIQLTGLTENTNPQPGDIILLKNVTTGKDQYIRFANVGGSGQATELAWDPDKAGGYATNEFAEFNSKLWKSLVDNNQAQPSEGADWTEVSRAFGARYVADTVFNQTDVFVVKDGNWYELNPSQPRPFQSTDFAAEFTAGTWIKLGVTTLQEAFDAGDGSIDTGATGLTVKNGPMDPGFSIRPNGEIYSFGGLTATFDSLYGLAVNYNSGNYYNSLFLEFVVPNKQVLTDSGAYELYVAAFGANTGQTNDQDPLLGNFHGNTANPTTTTILYFSKTDRIGVIVTQILDQIEPGDTIRITHSGNVIGPPFVYSSGGRGGGEFLVTGEVIDAGTYIKIPVTNQMWTGQDLYSTVYRVNFQAKKANPGGGGPLGSEETQVIDNFYISVRPSLIEAYINTASGNDANSGNYKNPFQSLTPLAAIQAGLTGNQVLQVNLKRGQTYNQKLVISTSGYDERAPLRIQDYGDNQAAPIIQCGTLVNPANWVVHAGDIYVINLPGITPSDLIVNGVKAPKGRDATTYSIDTTGNDGARFIQSDDLIGYGGTSFVGCHANFRERAWNPIDVRIISEDFVTGKLYYDGTEYATNPFNPAPLSSTMRMLNRLDFLTGDLEWYWDDVNKNLYLKSAVDPVNLDVYVALIDSGLELYTGAIADELKHIEVQNIDIHNAAMDAVYAQCELNYSLFEGMDIVNARRAGFAGYLAFTNNAGNQYNTFKKIDILSGATGMIFDRLRRSLFEDITSDIYDLPEFTGYVPYRSISYGGQGNAFTLGCWINEEIIECLFRRIHVKRAGADGFSIAGEGSIVELSIIERFARHANDVGGLYCGTSPGVQDTLTRRNTFRQNWIRNPYTSGREYYDLDAGDGVRGGYQDNFSQENNYLSNIFQDCGEGGWTNIDSDRTQWLHNLFINNVIGLYVNHIAGTTYNIDQMVVRDNHLFITDQSHVAFGWNSPEDNVSPIDILQIENTIHNIAGVGEVSFIVNGVTNLQGRGKALETFRDNYYPKFESLARIFDYGQEIDLFSYTSTSNMIGAETDDLATHAQLFNGAVVDTATIPAGGQGDATQAVKLVIDSATGVLADWFRLTPILGLNPGDQTEWTFEAYSDTPCILKVFYKQTVAPNTDFAPTYIKVPAGRWKLCKHHYEHPAGADVVAAGSTRWSVWGEGIAPGVTANVWIRFIPGGGANVAIKGTRSANRALNNLMTIEMNTGKEPMPAIKLIGEGGHKDVTGRYHTHAILEPGEAVVSVATDTGKLQAVAFNKEDGGSRELTEWYGSQAEYDALVAAGEIDPEFDYFII